MGMRQRNSTIDLFVRCISSDTSILAHPIGSKNMAIDIGVALSGRGYFPEVLPPCFCSRPLSEFLKANRKSVNDCRLNDRESSKLSKLNCPKNNGSRRTFSTPTPLNYLFISEFLKDHWEFINNHYKKKSKISASVPTIEDEPSPRPIKITSFSDLNLLVHKNIGHAPYMMRTDIAQFYPTLYTHAIPWAAHTKATAKSDRSKKSRNCFFNELDYHLRNCQDGQTLGLFVGPDAARVVSELIASDIDKFVTDKVGQKIIGATRFVDDYFVGVQTEQDAAMVLSALREALNSYELNLNDMKTRIVPTSKPMDDLWPLHLLRVTAQYLSDISVSEHQLSEVFDSALGFTSETSTQSPIKLLLRQLDRYNFESRDEFEFIEPYLLRFVHHFPYAIDYVCMIVGARVLRGKDISRESWKNVLEIEIGRYAGLLQHHEICWLLWLSIVAKIPLPNDLIDKVLGIGNAHVDAMLIAALAGGHIKNKLTYTPSSIQDMRSEEWLCIHEAILAGICRANLQNDELDLHKTLLTDHKSFIDFSIATDLLKKEGAVISGIRFGYEDDDEGALDPLFQNIGSVIPASSQDF